MEKVIKPNIEGEMDEFQRLSQDLKRDDDIDISVDEIVTAFENSKEETLTDDIWDMLENTESNEIEKDDWDSVMDIARTYKKTNPKKLKVSIQKGDYSRPLIVKLGNRYILVAGNTRLCTAAAMGVNPKVFIGKIDENSNKTDLNEKCWDGYKQVGGKMKNGKMVPNCVPTNEASSPAQQAAIAINMKKKGIKPKTETKEQTMASSSGSFEGPAVGALIKREIHKIHNSKLNEEQELDEVTDASSSGSYDVPLFGTSPKGRRNPLKIDGPDSIYKGRAVKDKKFPKWGGPDSVFVKIKEKCKKFPYCNQGNTGAIEFIKEDQELQTIISETSKKYGIPHNQLENVVLNEITKIFI
jgi:hypothetical protein